MSKQAKKSAAAKRISGIAYVAYVADLASREGVPSAKVAHLTFQCVAIEGARTIEEWDTLVVAAMRAEVSLAEALEFGEGDTEE